MPNHISINRDPYARTETIRRTVQTNKGCDWCGENPHGRLFQYGTESDNGRGGFHKGSFCSKSCHDAYHDR